MPMTTQYAMTSAPARQVATRAGGSARPSPPGRDGRPLGELGRRAQAVPRPPAIWRGLASQMPQGLACLLVALLPLGTHLAAAQVAPTRAEPVAVEQAAIAPASAAARSESYLTELSRYEARLAQLESEGGPFDNRLLEPLAAMTELATAADDHDRAADLLRRQLQVARTALGFKHPQVAALLRQLNDNAIARQDWEAVTEHLEHLRAIAARDDGRPSEGELEAMAELRQWQLTRFVLGAESDRARRFMAARELAKDIRDRARDLYGEESLEYIPWLYQFAYNDYQLVQLLNAKGGLTTATIDRLVASEGSARLNQAVGARGAAAVAYSLSRANGRIPVINADGVVGEAYLRRALSSVREIAKIAARQGDLEAEAMALIYQGDFAAAANRGSGLDSYREAMAKLRELGIPATEVARYFSRPVLIPQAQAELRFAPALAALDARAPASAVADGLAEEPGASPESPHLGLFVAWDEDVPVLPMPQIMEPAVASALPLHHTELRFNVSSRGKVSKVSALAATPDERGVRRKARRAARDLTLRPAIVDGKGVSLKGVGLSFALPPD